jgi:Icc-related predicted phosphoesterase
MTKLILLSDTHTKHLGTEIPDGDILIHAGDFSNIGERYDVEDFFEWLHSLTNVKHKVFIAGNHDKSFDSKYGGKKEWLLKLIEEGKKNNIHYLEDSMITIEGIRIYGMPWTPWFYGDYWAFNLKSEEMAEKVDLIPNCDVLVTHGPPKYILDKVKSDKIHVGCEHLTNKIKLMQPTLSVFGHIHEGHGKEMLASTECYNVSYLDENYKVKNQPVTYIYEHII